MDINENALWCRFLKLSFFSDEQEIEFDPELHIEFDIEKTRAAEPNRAVLRVFNLNEDTRNALKTRQRDRTKGEYTRVRLIGGYKPKDIEPNDVLFDGYIRRIHSNREGADIVTTLELGDGDLDYRNATVNNSFPKGTAYSEIIDYIRGQMPNVGVGNLSGVAQMGVTDKGYTISGWAKRFLDEICRKFDCRWSIQNGALEIIGNDEGIQRTTPLIAPSYCDEAGNRVGGSMIGMPVPTETGISVTTLLIPSIRPNTLLTVSTGEGDAERVYRANNVRYVGSNFGEQYYTIAECQEARGVEVLRPVNNGDG